MNVWRNDMDTILELKHVTKTYSDTSDHRVVALEDISFSVSRGEFFVLLGPSGSGKSTLLRIASGLEKDYRGMVSLAPGIERKDMSFVFQQYALWPWLTVEENIEVGLIARGKTEKNRKHRVSDELARLGLSKSAHSYPRELSGGMRQRVGIARALATDPKIIFLDEAFSELDSFTAEELRQELLKIWQEKKLTIVMVTHLVEEAIVLSDNIAILTPRPGKIEKIVTNTLPRPRQKRTQDFYTLEDHLYTLVSP
jgi:ABC-type nitrate/sulfonate/bicarbonate transport system ATPase subunit